MELYIVQHGEAKSEEEDPERPLTEKGKEEAGAVARKLAEADVKVEHIYHSPKLRAMQTADIFTTRLQSHATEIDGLKPMDDPKIAFEFVESKAKEGESIMLVGHLPHLSKLASLLLTGKEEPVISFRMGAAVCLAKEDRWQVKWILPPELA